jgi:hypothetical protein
MVFEEKLAQATARKLNVNYVLRYSKKLELNIRRARCFDRVYFTFIIPKRKQDYKYRHLRARVRAYVCMPALGLPLRVLTALA